MARKKQEVPDDDPPAPDAGRLDPSRWPALTARLEPVASLVPFAENPRLHSPAEVERLARSIRRWGVTMPALRDEEGTLIAGHRRILAAGLLGLDAFPVARAVGWTDEEKEAYRIADNQLTLEGGWDDGLLRPQVRELEAAGWDLSDLGFASHEIDVLLDDFQGLAGKVDAIEPTDAAADGRLTVTFDERHRAEVRRAVELAVDALGIEGVRVA